MLILCNWVANTQLYPPVHIYAGQPQGKQEKRAVAICEALYKFTWGEERNLIGELREASRAVDVISIMNRDGRVKKERIEKLFDEYAALAIEVNNRLQEVFKQHQDLNKWYEDHLKVTNQNLKKAINGYKRAQLDVIDMWTRIRGD